MCSVRHIKDVFFFFFSLEKLNTFRVLYAGIHYESMPIQMYLKILPPKKNENFRIKQSDIFHVSAQNIDCGY